MIARRVGGREMALALLLAAASLVGCGRVGLSDEEVNGSAAKGTEAPLLPAAPVSSEKLLAYSTPQNFGSILELKSVDLVRLLSGDFDCRATFKVLAKTTAALSVFHHAYDPAKPFVFAHAGFSPAPSEWNPGDEVSTSTILSGLAAGKYEIFVGVVDDTSAVRLKAEGTEDDRVRVGEIVVG